MTFGCLITSSCRKQTLSLQTSVLSEAHITAVEFENAKAKFKASPGFRTKEARVLFPMIIPGMTKEEVRSILGEPEEKGVLASSDSIWNYSVFYSQLISVTFEKDKVVKSVGPGI